MNKMTTIITVKIVFHQGGLVKWRLYLRPEQISVSEISEESILKSDQNLWITVTLSGQLLYPL